MSEVEYNQESKNDNNIEINSDNISVKNSEEFCKDLIIKSKTKRAKGSEISLDLFLKEKYYILTSSSTLIKDGRQARKIHTNLKKKNNFVTNKTKYGVYSIGFKEYKKQQNSVVKIYTRIEVTKVKNSKRRELKISRESFIIFL